MEVAGLVIGVTTAAIQTANAIRTLIQDIKDGPRSLDRLREEVETLGTVLIEVEKIPAFNSYPPSSSAPSGGITSTAKEKTRGAVGAKKESLGLSSGLPAPILAIQGCLDELRVIHARILKFNAPEKDRDGEGSSWGFSKLRTGYRMSKEDKDLAPIVLSLERRKMTLCLVLNTTISKYIFLAEGAWVPLLTLSCNVLGHS